MTTVPSVTSTDICNRALLAAGSRIQITGFPPTDTSVEAQTCNTLFVPTYQTLAQSAQWNHLRRQESLTLLAAASGTPENPDGVTLPVAQTPWLYEYQYPMDCLNFMWIVPSYPGDDNTNQTTANNAAVLSLANGGQIPYAVALDYFSTAPSTPVNVILTNESNAIGVFTQYQIDPNYWDTFFTQAMVASLAAYLVPALSLDLPLMQMNIKVAEKIISDAQTSDANEGVTVMDHVPDWIMARMGGNAYNMGTDYAGQVTAMSWPSYY